MMKKYQQLIDEGTQFLYRIVLDKDSDPKYFIGIHGQHILTVIKCFSNEDMNDRCSTFLESSFYKLGSKSNKVENGLRRLAEKRVDDETNAIARSKYSEKLFSV